MSVLDNYVCEGQMSMFDILNQDSLSGKTSPEHLVQTKVKTSDAYLKSFAELRIKPPQYLCLKKASGQIADASWEMGGALLGVYTIHSFGESPKDVVVSRLSEILVENPHPKYCLSARACQGILNRANKRGKQLPIQLEMALKRQAMSSETKSCPPSSQDLKPQSETPKTDSTSLVSKNVQDAQGGGKGILIQNEKTASLRTATNQSILTIDEKMGQTYVNEELGNTLSARDYKQPQAVCYGMDNERRRGVDEFVEQSPTITSRAGTGGNNVPVTINVETEVCVRKYEVDEPILLESNQNHATIQTDGISTALPASMGMGGGYVPMITEVQSMEVFHCTTEEDKVQTLKARDYKDPQVVAYGIEPGAASRMGGYCYEEISGTLRAEMGDNQASVACYGLDRASFNQGQNAKFDFSVEEELAPTLVNRGPGGVLTGQ